ncbi:hypothetical protein ZOSMA_42G01250 [Zostera marina]|uniref:10 kDa chaperonin n=1 Tax=Zostera marina TaxID=29655 RepID=A0A0K9P4G7_ZOSMR|nr:hypothetical protein ZOSMA_42G01250 [Zostera marina]
MALLTLGTIARPFVNSSSSSSDLHHSFSRSSFSSSSFSRRNNSVPFSRGNNAAVMAKICEPNKVTPQADRVLLRLEDLPEKSSGGVLLPKSAVKFERYLMGQILSVGADVGEEVAAGKKVLFSDVNAYEVDLGTDAKHCFCRVADLLAVVE